MPSGSTSRLERVPPDSLHGELRDWFDSQILYRANGFNTWIEPATT